MRVPNAGRAVIEPAKVRDYLLSSTHLVGRFKARFFLGRGFRADDGGAFALALREQHLPQEATLAELDQYGQRFIVRAISPGTGWRGTRRQRLVCARG
ncbi:MAG: hypothetical protein EXQ59_00255 [Acidobacteria bacterium]|nr:hypothetical protein [Acidobacteriota bacterium]